MPAGSATTGNSNFASYVLNKPYALKLATTIKGSNGQGLAAPSGGKTPGAEGRRCRSEIYRGKMAGDRRRKIKLRMTKNEEPCWLCGRAGFSKIDDLW